MNEVACCCEGVNSYPTEELVSDVRQRSVEVEARCPVGIAPKAITYNRCTTYYLSIHAYNTLLYREREGERERLS